MFRQETLEKGLRKILHIICIFILNQKIEPTIGSYESLLEHGYSLHFIGSIILATVLGVNIPHFTA
jgi:putative Mn2+ efflux pump MntP